jgi:hypothetical protein
VNENVNAGRRDIRQLPTTTVCPLPYIVAEEGPNQLAMPTETAETASKFLDVWVALAGVVAAAGARLRGLLYLKARDLSILPHVAELLGQTVHELKGNSTTMAKRLRDFQAGQITLLMVPASHCSGMDLPMVTHIFVPYKPTECTKADIVQLVGRVRRHGSASATRVVFIDHGMDAVGEVAAARDAVGEVAADVAPAAPPLRK